MAIHFRTKDMHKRAYTRAEARACPPHMQLTHTHTYTHAQAHHHLSKTPFVSFIMKNEKIKHRVHWQTC